MLILFAESWTEPLTEHFAIGKVCMVMANRAHVGGGGGMSEMDGLRLLAELMTVGLENRHESKLICYTFCYCS